MTRPELKGLVLPDQHDPQFLQQLIRFGNFLETETRPECSHDLTQWPNLFWQTIEARMLEGLSEFLSAKVSAGTILMLQWYNSGVFIRTAQLVMAFDVLPIPRYYGWPEPDGLTERIASAVDVLMITHGHQDHFDERLAKACLAAGKNVIMPSSAASEGLMVSPAKNEAMFAIGDTVVRSFTGCHVWRQSAEEVALAYYQVSTGDSFRLVFCGDADYTKGFPGILPDVDALFITWRNPGPKYEDGHAQQQATTSDAVKIAVDELRPRQLFLQHYGELDHVYKGFSASYAMAADLINRFPEIASVYFWGDVVKIKTGE